MLPSQVGFLHLSPPAPRASFRSGAMDDCVVIEHLVVGGNDQACRAYDAEGPDSDGVMHAGTCGDSVEVSDGGGFDTCAIQVIVVKDMHRNMNARQPISNRLSSPIRMTSFLL